VVPFVPPATRTCPLDSTAVPSNVALWRFRADVIAPADAKLPDPEAALKRSVDERSEVPLRPATIRTLPLARAVAVCPSRAVVKAVNVVQADVPSNSCTLVRLALPEFPPTTSTLLFNAVLPGTVSSVAVWERRALAMFATLVQAPAPDAGLYRTAVLSTVVPDSPPATSTCPLPSRVAVPSCRAEGKLAAAIQVPVVGE
jgi:hypothetical protein